MKVGVFQGGERDARVLETLEAFKAGLNHLGVEWFSSDRYRPCDVAVVWGITSMRNPHTNYRDMIRMAQPNTIVLERGFVRRAAYFAAGWGDTGGYADFCNANSPPDRWLPTRRTATTSSYAARSRGTPPSSISTIRAGLKI